MTNTHLPADKSLADCKAEAKSLVAKEGVLQALKFIRGLLPESASKFNLLILMESRFNELNRKIAEGIISEEDQNLEANKINHDFLNCIDTLKDEDFAVKTATEEAEVPDLRIGKTLYRIPQKMQVGVEVECSIWVSFDIESILKEVEQQTTDEVRDIRISNVMGVELIPHGSTDDAKTFEITTYDETEQIIEKGLPTSWVFYVTPLMEGKFPLILRISVIELIDGEKLQKTKVLREVVQIIGEAVPVPEDGIKAKEARGLVVATPKNEGGKGAGAVGASKVGKTGGTNVISNVMMAIIGLLLTIGGIVAYQYFNNDSVPRPNPDDENKLEIVDIKKTEIGINSITDTTEIITILNENPTEQRRKDALDRLKFLRDSLAIKKSGLNGTLPETETPTSSETGTNTPPQTGTEITQLSGGATDPIANPPTPPEVPPTTRPETETPTTAEIDTPTNPPPRETETPIDPAPESPPNPETEQPNPLETDPPTTFGGRELKSEYPYHPNCEETENSGKNSCTNALIEAAIQKSLATLEASKGSGLLSFVITKNGKLKNVRMAQSSSDMEFGKAVRRSVSALPLFVSGRKELKKEVNVKYDEESGGWGVEFLK